MLYISFPMMGIYYITAIASKCQTAAPEGKWVSRSGIEIPFIYNIHRPKVHN